MNSSKKERYISQTRITRKKKMSRKGKRRGGCRNNKRKGEYEGIVDTCGEKQKKEEEVK